MQLIDIFLCKSRTLERHIALTDLICNTAGLSLLIDGPVRVPHRIEVLNEINYKKHLKKIKNWILFKLYFNSYF